MINTPQFLLENPLNVVLRDFPADCLLYTVEALIKGGIKSVVVEFSPNSERAERNSVLATQGLKKCFGNDLLVGVGNVFTENMVKLAKGAGADFIVSPAFSAEVIERAKAVAIPIVSGGFTVTELYEAQMKGATLSALTPAKLGKEFGIAEFIGKTLPQVNLAAAGDIDFPDILPLAKMGYKRFFIGGSLANITLAKKGEYGIIELEAKRYMEVFEKLK